MQDLNLRYLYEAAKLGSMRAAADNLGVAVSSVSRQISQLEADMGVGLIEHGRRNIKLTETGLLLIEHYSEQLRVNEAFDAKLSDIKGLRTGRIHLAIGEGFIGQPLSNLLVGFNAKHPGLFINVHMSASSNEVVRLVAEDDAHLGLVFQSSDDPRIRVLASVRQPLCAIMNVEHPLAGHKLLKLADLKSYPPVLAGVLVQDSAVVADRRVQRRGVAAAEHHFELDHATKEPVGVGRVLHPVAGAGGREGGGKSTVRCGAHRQYHSARCGGTVDRRLGRRLPPAPLRMLMR